MLKSKFVKLYITAYEVELCLRLILKDKHEHVCDQHNIHAVTINMEVSLFIIYSAFFSGVYEDVSCILSCIIHHSHYYLLYNIICGKLVLSKNPSSQGDKNEIRWTF